MSPHVFGLDAERAAPWRAAYEAALHGHLERARPDDDPHRAPELFTAPTLWAAWDERFPAGPLSLPAAVPTAVDEHTGRDELCKRQVARTLLGQTFRLTATAASMARAARGASWRVKKAGHSCSTPWPSWASRVAQGHTEPRPDSSGLHRSPESSSAPTP